MPSRPVLCVLVVIASLVTAAPAFGQLRFAPTDVGLSYPTGGTTGSAWFDFDGDGWIDVALSNRDSFPDRVLRNHGGRRFVSVRVPGDGFGESNGVAWGDVDNDGQVELLVVQNRGLQLYDLRADGDSARVARRLAGDLTDNARFPGAYEAADFGDFDGDGDLDVVAARYAGPQHLFRNDGRGNFISVDREGGSSV